jgi:superfamily I DNA/RNA helicase
LTFSTIHSAKGLEWDTVYLLGCEEGSMPSKKAETFKDIEEEKRLFYVACTRAKNKLILCVVVEEPSIFIKVLDENNYDYEVLKQEYVDYGSRKKWKK